MYDLLIRSRATGPECQLIKRTFTTLADSNDSSSAPYISDCSWNRLLYRCQLIYKWSRNLLGSYEVIYDDNAQVCRAAKRRRAAIQRTRVGYCVHFTSDLRNNRRHGIT